MTTKDMTTTVCLAIVAALVVSTSSSSKENRTMSECYAGGLKCSIWAICYIDTANNDFECRCLNGYEGELCEEDVNECERGPAPCLMRGVCHNVMGSFRCNCLPGWVGTHCQHSDGSDLSTCVTGYTGVNCTDDFDECTQWTDNPCEHGSSCTNAPGSFSCSCATGWEGRICNQDIDECNITTGLCHNGGNCTNIPGSYKCVCPYPYTGVACDDVSATPSSTTTPARPSISSTPASTTSAVSPSAKTMDSSGPGNDGVPTVWVITGSCIGLVVVGVGVVAVLLLYKIYHRRGRQVGY